MEYLKTLVIFILILVFVGLLNFINAENIGLFVSLFLGLFCVIRFRQMTKFLLGDTKGLKLKWSRKWEPKFTQLFIFVLGIIFVITSPSELLSQIF